MKIYVDGLMCLNFLVDLLLLLGTNRLAGYPSDIRRLAAASALGGVYAGICLIPDFRFLGSLFWRGICLGLMGSIAFGCSRSALRRCGIFWVLSLALGGFAVSLGRADLGAILLSGMLLWGICRFSFAEPTGSRRVIPLEIRYRDRTVKLLALQDTGNTLRDPVSGEPVLVICASAARDLTGLTQAQLQDPLGTAAAAPMPGLRLIPYRTVGRGGMMLAMVFEDTVLNGKGRRRLVAFSSENFGSGEGYQALTGGIVSC